jgi:hypothetical protein
MIYYNKMNAFMKEFQHIYKEIKVYEDIRYNNNAISNGYGLDKL